MKIIQTIRGSYLPKYDEDTHDDIEERAVKTQIIHDFASKILNESCDTNVDFTKVIDEYYWELI